MLTICIAIDALIAWGKSPGIGSFNLVLTDVTSPNVFINEVF